MDNKGNKTIAALQDIHLELNNQAILRNINLQINKGEITTLIGPNGGGKTSIARILIGIMQPSKGKVSLDKRNKIGYMPQKLNIDNTIPLRVVDFIKLNITMNKIQEANLNKLAKKLNIENILTKQIHDISGGQLQKASLLRALINDPSLLVLDEPTQYMDIAGQVEFYQLIEEIREQNHCAILMISHDLHMVMQKTDNVICVNHHICCQGDPSNINNHPEYISLFGKQKADNIAIYSHHHDHKH